MIRLKNVSKFYYSKGVIATGFSKVNLSFKIGEFVAITGESGSGKSTLLNVISGLDTYEDGEMYVNGEETSHYVEKDWENYRRKYIGNIYQNFNLINSYTVYQNIDLILSLNRIPKKVRRRKIFFLLKRVGMLRYKNTKVSKLSGGQKQRVAIARALAKDVPVIIADEPTASLDKKSAVQVIRLLKEISKDKLVIIVTHNYDQVEEYVTRKIMMHDGRVIEDERLKPIDANTKTDYHDFRCIHFLDEFQIGFRNTFNVLSKFILLFLVYSFVVAALMGEYSFFKKGEYEESKQGTNTVFLDTNDHRIIINKEDKTSFSEDEIQQIKELSNIDYVVENDTLIDKEISLSDSNEQFWFSGIASSRDRLLDKVDYGVLPVNDDEIVIEGSRDNYYLSDDKEELLNQTYHITTDTFTDDSSYKIVGIRYNDDVSLSGVEFKYYVSDTVLDKLQFQTHQENSTVSIDFMGKIRSSSNASSEFRLEANNWVTPKTAIIPEDLNIECDKNNCINKMLTVNAKNIYYEESIPFTIAKIYNVKNMPNILEIPNFSKDNFDMYYNGTIYINPIDYNELFNKGTYQMSVYVDDIEKISKTNHTLQEMGYHTLMIKDSLVDVGITEIIRIIKLIVTIVLVITLFFISYFIIKIILKSRNIYYSILRMLGASKRVCRNLLMIELFVVSNISYFLFIVLAELNRFGFLKVSFIDTVNTYFKLNDYFVLYGIVVGMSLLISLRYSRKLFQNSVMNTYREEM